MVPTQADSGSDDHPNQNSLGGCERGCEADEGLDFEDAQDTSYEDNHDKDDQDF